MTNPGASQALPPATPMSVPDLAAYEAMKPRARAWFESLRDKICAAFESIEDQYAADGGHPPPGVASAPPGAEQEAGPGRFARTAWERPASDGPGGGGVMSVMRGRVFEKVGVNVSTVSGKFSEEFARQIPGADRDAQFWASGISLVAHLRSPRVPAAHFNTRMLVTSRGWFGGGGDITPMRLDSAEAAEDAAEFHLGFRTACDAHDPDYYPKYKEWCDRYFYLPHRDEPRGLGGIFFDYHATGDIDADFAFARDVGAAFLETYPAIIRRRMHEAWTQAEREHQLIRRGRYVEFNLIHDRGTLFGLKTGGNTEAILMSLPPEVRWP